MSKTAIHRPTGGFWHRLPESRDWAWHQEENGGYRYSLIHVPADNTYEVWVGLADEPCGALIGFVDSFAYGATRIVQKHVRTLRRVQR